MRRREREAEFREYVSARLERMRYFAYLSCGDWHRAEDAVQTAFEKLYVAWERPNPGSRDAYTRRIIVNTLINEHRRGWFRRERPAGDLPPAEAPSPDRDAALSLLEALRRLPLGQRTTVVLRYWEDLSVDQTAREMGCTPSTVKSQTARAVARLRELLPDLDPTEGEHDEPRLARVVPHP
ncbi:RNA polymerase sigma-70 factor (sigma-E family) [Stackebrandtia albiflava]|uniref:RNA polymerase sigma-70 factor (Sigma-E family) n=1 Tax=Stackebrandtia albiflava TaxID=406432 RepID=A0A562V9M5_9ACTN|nr:SigE family RNA polymerase sigma factor [Stackebrandtia albiflava]TWJ14548.1 RNA polymerase sigma-70 factor (sigma-E family) [Stackebrandtia albiflava]